MGRFMSMNIKIKNRFFITTAILAVFLCLLSSPILMASADSTTEAEKEYNEAVNSYIGDIEDPGELIDKVMNDAKNNPTPDKNSIQYIVSRLFQPGVYLNEVEDGILDSDLEIPKGDVVKNGKLCNPDTPLNLINHNCNIPNFTTELLQNIVSTWETPFSNAGKTSARVPFGLGVPNNIPGGLVPVNPESRNHTYTALELFGYDLKLTSYNGEWDKITTSTKARMLSNFGIIDHTRLLGNTLWESVQGAVSTSIQGFDFTSDRFGRPISGLFEGFVSSGLKSTIDTSDLNVVATSAWKREKLNDTLYNVYVLSDKEVLAETARKFFNVWIDKMEENAESNQKLLDILKLRNIPSFTYIEEWETEESIKARNDAEEYNKKEKEKAIKSKEAIIAYDASIGAEPGMGGIRPVEYIPQYIPIPEPVFYTEAEQIVFWSKDVKNVDQVNLAKSYGIIQDITTYETFDPLRYDWTNNQSSLETTEFAASGETIQKIMQSTDKTIYEKNPHMDARQPISHYACANDDGTPMRDSNGNLVYLYEKRNSASQEFVNPLCKPARDPITSGYFGNGWHIDRPIDTRHFSVVLENSEPGGSLLKSVENFGVSTIRSINSFLAKLTNVSLGFSFSPVMKELGIDTIVSKLVEGFRDTIFFPMAGLVAAIGGIMLFFQLMKNGSAWQLVSSVLLTFLVFTIGATFLLRPELTLKIADEWPSKVDNFLVNIVLNNENEASYCTTGEENDGIRAAQCNVWASMVFNPWVRLQFGTDYSNLYAKGYAPSNGSEMLNSEANAALVGNAEVNLGNGVVENNWALYQLSKTKTGTITTSDFRTLGVVDKDMYRLVDLQAGPNNGEGTDSRYFAAWSQGRDSGNLLIMLISLIQAILVSIVIFGLGAKKIEASFMFALSLVMLPIMLLYSLVPQGKMKLKGYLSTLLTMLLRRFVVIIMLGVYLRIMNGVYAMGEDINTTSMIMIVVSSLFLFYRKEIMGILSGSGGENSLASQVKEVIQESVPKEIKQRYYMAVSSVKGSVSGFAGGAVGTVMYNNSLNRAASKHDKSINRLVEARANRELTEEEKKELRTLEINKAEIERTIAANKHTNANSVFSGAVSGAKNASGIIGRRKEREFRRKGFGSGKIFFEAKEEVLRAGQQEIAENKDAVSADVYRDIISTGDTTQNTKTSTGPLDNENVSLLLDENVQRLVRKEAEKRRKMARDKAAMNNALSEGDLDMTKLRDILEKKRQLQRQKDRVFNPKAEERRLAEMDGRKDSSNITSSAQEIKEQILRTQGELEKEEENNEN
jgi:hypothetical protein